jgi:hypothetical protein
MPLGYELDLFRQALSEEPHELIAWSIPTDAREPSVLEFFIRNQQGIWGCHTYYFALATLCRGK